MAIKTKIRAAMLSASMPTDAENPAVASSLAVSDLAGTLNHMASAIKRIHGGSSFTENVVGEFLTDVSIKGATPKLTIGDAGAEDTMIVFDGNAQDYRIGLDDGTDKLELGIGSAHGTTTAMTIDSSQQVAVTATTAASSKTTGALVVAGGMSTQADLYVGDDLMLDSDSAVLGFGDDGEVTLTHVHNSGLTLAGGDNKLNFRDAQVFIASDADGHLIAEADAGVTLAINNSAVAEITSAGLNVAGTLTGDTSLTLDAVTISTAEIGVLDGVSAGTVAASKAVVVDGNKDAASFRNLTATGAVTAGSFVIGSADIAEAELEMIDGITAGTAAASKALVADSNIDITALRNVTATGVVTAAGFTIGSAAIVEAELEMIDGITAGTAAASKAVVLDGSKNIATIGTVGCGAITSTGTSTLASLVVTGDLTVEGTQTAINSTQVNVEDKQMRLGIPGGMTIDGDATYALTSNVVTVTNSSHGLTNGEFVYISDPAATPLIPEGVYEITSVADVNTFTFAYTRANVSAGTAINHSVDNVTAATADGSGIFVSVGSTTPTGIEWDTTNGWQILGGDLDISASKNLSFAGTSILADSGGTMTLSNVDALDATTEATIEAAIDTLANLGSMGTNGSELEALGSLDVAQSLKIANSAFADASRNVTAGTIAGSTGTFSGILKTDDATDASNATDGSLQTDGGLSVAKKIFNSTDVTLAASSGIVTMGAATALTVSAAGLVNVNNATEATSATDGSLQTDGGLSVVKSAVIGDDLDLLSDGAIMNIGSTSKFTLTDQAANNCVMAASGHRLAFGNAGEYLTGDGTNLSVVSSADIILDPGGNNVLPGGDSADDLGADGTAWRTIYVDNVFLNGQGRLDLDDDGDTSIRAAADDSIDFEVGGTDMYGMIADGFLPVQDGQRDLGSSSAEWKDLYIDGVAYIDDLRADALGAALDCANQAMTNVNIDSGAIELVAVDIDGGSDIGAALVDADLIMVDDGANGTNRKCAMSRVKTYLQPTQYLKVFTSALGANAALDTGLTGADFGAPSTSSGGAAHTTQVYLNGQLLLGGDNASANNDYYEHGDGAGNITFEFAMQVDDVLQVVVA